MTQTAIAAAARRSLQTTAALHPASITLAGKTITCGGAVESRGIMEDARGGFIQGRKVTCLLPFGSLTDADLMDSTTGTVKRQTLTITRGSASQAYRVKRAEADPTRTMWTIEAEQAVA